MPEKYLILQFRSRHHESHWLWISQRLINIIFVQRKPRSCIPCFKRCRGLQPNNFAPSLRANPGPNPRDVRGKGGFQTVCRKKKSLFVPWMRSSGVVLHSYHQQPSWPRGGADHPITEISPAAIELYGYGSLSQALAVLDDIPESGHSRRSFTFRGQLLLSVGRIDEARADIGQALKLVSGNSDALPLQAIR
jgi:hypothetical protein